jgi:hypothetical protein
MPPEPPQGAVNDHMNCASGNAVIASTTSRESRWDASRVESGEASMYMLTWPWSSIGASSRRELAYRGQAAIITASAAATIAQRISSAPSSR